MLDVMLQNCDIVCYLNNFHSFKVFINMRPINSASPNKYPITNFASVDRDKTRVNSYAP